MLSEIEPLYNLTVLPTSAIPEIVGVLSFVREEVDKDDGAIGAALSRSTFWFSTKIVSNSVPL